eukprot:SAG11_NODE_34506_length_271_cov_1.203488_1_plen_27_part_01
MVNVKYIGFMIGERPRATTTLISPLQL